jgi:hypothetical protein
MSRTLLFAMAAALVTGGTGCAAAHSHVAAPTGIAITADLPPSPATWPKYPHFSQHSCWGSRPSPAGPPPLLTRVAPSYAPPPRAHPLSPRVVAERLLARFGDRRYIRSITFSPAPPLIGTPSHIHHAGGRPPANALNVTIAPGFSTRHKPGHWSPTRILAASIADFEDEIVGAALRDDLCDAGGPPLLPSASWWALDQRFPNPSPAAFRKRVALVGKRFGFTVASLRLLRPRQIAPLLIVKTALPRQRFVKEIPKIMELLNPATPYTQHGNVQTALTFEAFFFAVEDSRGPFALSYGLARSGSSGTEWGANPCLYPDGAPDATGYRTARAARRACG